MNRETMRKEFIPVYKTYTTVKKLASAKAQRYVYPIDLSDRGRDLGLIATKLGMSKAEAIREAIKHYAEYLRGLEVVTYRELAKGQAKEEVRKYLKGKDRVSADEISDALRVDMSLVNEVLMELWQEGWVEPQR